MNMLAKQKDLHRKARIVYLINRCDARLETLQSWIRCQGSNFFYVASYYRDSIITIRERRKSLISAYMESEGIVS